MAELSAEAEGGGVDGTAEDEASSSDTGRGSGGSWRNVLMPLEARHSFTAGLENIASATREVRDRAAAMGARPPRAKPRFGGGAKDGTPSRRDDADVPRGVAMSGTGRAPPATRLLAAGSVDRTQDAQPLPM